VSDAAPVLRWAALSRGYRAALAGRLAGLWQHPSDESAFGSLAVDKQQALLIFVRRLTALGLWGHVASVTNVYGVGGVGMNFEDAAGLSAALRLRADFTPRFAAHADSAEGYAERRPSAALHVLRAAATGRWAAHFDLHGAMSGAGGALRHLFAEKLGGHRPDWREIASALGYEVPLRGDDDAVGPWPA
jgi:hypothetical protein